MPSEVPCLLKWLPQPRLHRQGASMQGTSVCASRRRHDTPAGSAKPLETTSAKSAELEEGTLLPNTHHLLERHTGAAAQSAGEAGNMPQGRGMLKLGRRGQGVKSREHGESGGPEGWGTRTDAAASSRPATWRWRASRLPCPDGCCCFRQEPGLLWGWHSNLVLSNQLPGALSQGGVSGGCC